MFPQIGRLVEICNHLPHHSLIPFTRELHQDSRAVKASTEHPEALGVSIAPLPAVTAGNSGQQRATGGVVVDDPRGPLPRVLQNRSGRRCGSTQICFVDLSMESSTA
ncbi:hypothetical protein E4U19_000792 [Claviceps sp. Clav32 group G5]|nr:hypothetical protein E4U19_000792 [Claviceps sp. Clav32 group G5]